MKDEILQYISIQVNHSVCKTATTLPFHPASAISKGLGDEISVTKVIEGSKCPDPKKLWVNPKKL